MNYSHQYGDPILNTLSVFLWNGTSADAILKNIVTGQGEHVDVEIRREGQESTSWHGCYAEGKDDEFTLHITAFRHTPVTGAIAGTIQRVFPPGRRARLSTPGNNDDMGSFTGTKTSP